MVMKWSCHKTTPSGQEKTSFFKDLVSQRYKHAMDLKNNSKKKIKNKKPPTTILPYYHSASKPHQHFSLQKFYKHFEGSMRKHGLSVKKLIQSSTCWSHFVYFYVLLHQLLWSLSSSSYSQRSCVLAVMNSERLHCSINRTSLG